MLQNQPETAPRAPSRQDREGRAAPPSPTIPPHTPAALRLQAGGRQGQGPRLILSRGLSPRRLLLFPTPSPESPEPFGAEVLGPCLRRCPTAGSRAAGGGSPRSHRLQAAGRGRLWKGDKMQLPGPRGGKKKEEIEDLRKNQPRRGRTPTAWGRDFFFFLSPAPRRGLGPQEKPPREPRRSRIRPPKEEGGSRA